MAKLLIKRALHITDFNTILKLDELSKKMTSIQVARKNIDSAYFDLQDKKQDILKDLLRKKLEYIVGPKEILAYDKEENTVFVYTLQLDDVNDQQSSEPT